MRRRRLDTAMKGRCNYTYLSAPVPIPAQKEFLVKFTMSLGLIMWTVAWLSQSSLGMKSVVRTSRRDVMDSEPKNKQPVVRKVSISPNGGMLEVSPSGSENQLDAVFDLKVINGGQRLGHRRPFIF